MNNSVACATISGTVDGSSLTTRGTDLRELSADPAGADAPVAVLAAVRQYNGSTAVSLLRLAEHG